MARTFYVLLGSSGQNAAAWCSGRTHTSRGGSVSLTDETGPASTTRSIELASSETLRSATGIQGRIGPALASWSAANYDVDINISTGNMNLTLDEIHLCRVDTSYGAVATIGSLTGIARGLGSTGSVTHTVSGSASSGASSDYLIVLCVATNGAMSTQTASGSMTVTTAAFDAPAVPRPLPILSIRQAVMRATLH